MILLNKPVGQTPLEAIQELRNKNSELKNVKRGYAGRLDPMAEGVLLVLEGLENKHKEKYQNLDKEYECEVLFEVETDTYDILGLPNVILNEVKDLGSKDRDSSAGLRMTLRRFVGEHEQEYPPYSSKTVNGKPLFQYARENKLNTIKIPSRKIVIYSIKVLKFFTIKKESLKSMILNKIDLVKGDFRQEEIKKGWEELFKDTKNSEFTAVKLKVHCSSGTYIRSIAQELGRKVGTGAIALSIKRTKIGNFMLK